MSIYSKSTFYRLMNLRLGSPKVGVLRRETLAPAKGKVLEIGFGSGLNLPHYPGHIKEITAIDPTPMPVDRSGNSVSPTVLTMSAEKMDFQDRTFDTVVCTFTLCSIAQPSAALLEVSRVLKPDGRLLFIEHGKSANPFIAGLQHLTNPLYRRIAFGCNVNRDMVNLLTENGFKIEKLKIVHTCYPISGIYFYGTAV